MKKRILTAVILIFVALSLTACGEKAMLSFSNNWNIGYYEEAEYSVKYYEDYASGNYTFTKSSAIANTDLTVSYSDGSLKIRTEVFDKLSVTDENVLKSNILNEIPASEGLILCTTSEFNITASYKYGDMTEAKEYQDKITEKVYFCQGKLGFAPIYSEVENRSSALSYKSNEFSFEERHTKSYSLYNVSSYTCKVQILNTDTGAVTNETEKTYNYSYKTVIDNAEFLFAVRFFNITDKTASCPVTSYNYLGLDKPVAYRSYQNATEENITVAVNGEDKTVNIPVTCVSYEINESTSGKSQIVFIQNAADSENAIGNKNLLVKYAEPLPIANSFYYQGALVFTLSSVNFN